MARCSVCGSKDDVFTCPFCNKTYCYEHVGSSDIFYCKKHSAYEFFKEDAMLRDGRCQIVEKSKCPKCKSLLELAKTESGHYYLRCLSCGWNSRDYAPLIENINPKKVLKEGERIHICSSTDICHEKFKRKKGRFYCKECFHSFLTSRIAVPVHDISHRFSLTEDEVVKIIKKLIASKELEGFYENSPSMFINYSHSLDAQLLSSLQTNGYLETDALQSALGVNKDVVIKLIINLIRKHSLRGCFDKDHKKYYSETYLMQLLKKKIEEKGRIPHKELALEFNIPEGLVKNYLIFMIKNNVINAYFADKGKETITKDELEFEIENYVQKKGVFLVNSLANHLKITPELTRKMLFHLNQQGVIRGIFTQNLEFITEDTLREKIKAILSVYREISIKDLAKKLAITEHRVEETLASLITGGHLKGHIDTTRGVFVLEGPISSYPTPQNKISSPSTPQSNAAIPGMKGEIEVVRQYDFVGGQLHFKVVVRNKSNMAIHDVKVILDVPSSYRRARDLITIPVIDPGNSHGVDFYLEPAECGISTIGGTVLYKDALGNTHSIHIKGKEVQIKCPLVIKTLDTIEDCYKAIQSLPSDARAFIVADLPPQMAYAAAYRAVSQFDTRNVASYEDDKQGYYEAEAWFSSEAKVTGGRIITRVYMNGKTSTLEIRVWCNDAGQLTGFLAKIIELLFVEINLMRKIKAEERGKTLDLMAITRNIMEVLDMCMLRYKASSIRLKLSDILTRLKRIGPEIDSYSKDIEKWITYLEQKYKDDEELIEEEDADKLEKEIEIIHQKIESQLSI